MDAARQYRFKPAVKRGEPMLVDLIIRSISTEVRNARIPGLSNQIWGSQDGVL